MSSTYYTLCLSHDPAIEYRPHRTPEEALAEIAAGGITEHPHCDLVVLRMSGGPSELVCPPSRENRPDGCLAHPDPIWIDADVLHCLAAVHRSTDPELLAAASATRLFRHWPRQRLHRLRGWLDFPSLLPAPEQKADPR